MNVTWVIEGKGGDSWEVEDAEAACTVVSGAVREAFGNLSADALNTLLGAVYALRLPMVTEGASAVRNGEVWATSTGPILVTLSP